MGNSQSIYLANGSGQGVNIIVGLQRDWAIVDFVADIAQFCDGAGELKLLAEGADLPETLETFEDLYQYLNHASRLLSGINKVTTEPDKAAKDFIDGFLKTSLQIPAGEYKEINDKSFIDTYLSADGLAGLFGAKTVSVIAMSQDGKQVAIWDTNVKDSWIATSNQTIVRSVFGELWKESPAEGSIPWPRKG